MAEANDKIAKKVWGPVPATSSPFSKPAAPIVKSSSVPLFKPPHKPVKPTVTAQIASATLPEPEITEEAESILKAQKAARIAKFEAPRPEKPPRRGRPSTRTALEKALSTKLPPPPKPEPPPEPKEPKAATKCIYFASGEDLMRFETILKKFPRASVSSVIAQMVAALIKAADEQSLTTSGERSVILNNAKIYF